jgi:ATP synthase F1 gamma subunit
MLLSELRKELRFNAELLSLVDTLKNVAAAQYHVLEKQKERFGDFMEAFQGFFRVVTQVEAGNPLVEVMTETKGIIVVTSDSGFMGGLNGGVIRMAIDQQGDLPDDKVSYMVIGDKGTNFFRDTRRTHQSFKGIGQETIYEQAVEVKNFIVQQVLEKKVGQVVIVYPKALSFSSQSIEVVHLLPCASLFKADKPAAGENGAEVVLSNRDKWLNRFQGVVIESSFFDIAKYLAGEWVVSKLYEVFEDSKLAEFSARAMHLEGSIQKVQTEYKRVKHQCFKAAHELIDKGMRESFSAKMIKEKKKKFEKKKDAEANKA